jgi:hypothetical protein
LLHDVRNNPEEYEVGDIESTETQARDVPSLYELPEPPAMWNLGETEDKTEGVMHLSMGIQKEVFKFIHKWSTKQKKGDVNRLWLGRFRK